jgi:hypothetical protein
MRVFPISDPASDVALRPKSVHRRSQAALGLRPKFSAISVYSGELQTGTFQP